MSVVMYKQLKQIIEIINCDDFKIINSDHFNLQNLQIDKNIPKFYSSMKITDVLQL